MRFSIRDVIDWTTLYFRILELSTCRLIRSDVLELDTNDKLISGDNHLLLDPSDYWWNRNKGKNNILDWTGPIVHTHTPVYNTVICWIVVLKNLMKEWQVCFWFDKSYCICTSIYIEIDIKVCCTEHFCQSIIVYNVVTCTLRCLIIYYFRWHPTLNSIRIPRTNTDQYRKYRYTWFLCFFVLTFYQNDFCSDLLIEVITCAKSPLKKRMIHS